MAEKKKPLICEKCKKRICPHCGGELEEERTFLPYIPVQPWVPWTPWYGPHVTWEGSNPDFEITYTAGETTGP